MLALQEVKPDSLSSQVNQVLNASVDSQMGKTLHMWLSDDRSIEPGVATLTTVLLKVSNRKYSNDIDKIQSKATSISSHNAELREKIQSLQFELNGQRQRLNTMMDDLNNHFVEKFNLLVRSQRDLDYTLPIHESFVRKYQLKLANEMFYFWSFVPYGSSIMSVLFTPIIPIQSLASIQVDLVRVTLMNLCRFMHQLAEIFCIQLPFSMKWEPAYRLVIESVQFLPPKFGSNSSVPNDQQYYVHDLSKKAIVELSWCLSKICINLISLCVNLKLVQPNTKMALRDVCSPSNFLLMIYNRFGDKNSLLKANAILEQSILDYPQLPLSVSSPSLTKELKLGSLDSTKLALNIVHLLESPMESIVVLN